MTPTSRTAFRPHAMTGLALCALVSTGFATSAGAVSFDNKPKILLHAQGVTNQNGCGVNIVNCVDAVTEAPVMPPYENTRFVYVLTGKGNLPDVAGVNFGITYQQDDPDGDQDLVGLEIYSWTLCADLEFPSAFPVWPRPNSGTLIIWDSFNDCQSGDVAVAGYFYCGSYSDDVLEIIERPSDGRAEVRTCAGTTYDLDPADLGYLSFSADLGTDGCNPCNGECPEPQPPPGPGSAAILVHITSVTAKNGCAAGAISSCSTAVVKGGLSAPDVGPYYFVHLLTARGEAPHVAGLQCGISYDGNLPEGASNLTRIDVFSWTLCATLEFPAPSPAWPGPGSGNLITWDPDNDCQTTSTAVAGYFYMAAYSEDVFRITPRPVDGVAKIASCLAAETNVAESNLGFAAFSANAATEGCNPCLVSCAEATPVRITTWSGVKTLLR